MEEKNNKQELEKLEKKYKRLKRSIMLILLIIILIFLVHTLYYFNIINKIVKNNFNVDVGKNYKIIETVKEDDITKICTKYFKDTTIKQVTDFKYNNSENNIVNTLYYDKNKSEGIYLFSDKQSGKKYELMEGTKFSDYTMNGKISFASKFSMRRI